LTDLVIDILSCQIRVLLHLASKIHVLSDLAYGKRVLTRMASRISVLPHGQSDSRFVDLASQIRIWGDVATQILV
jgi:hypothetical protein